MKDSDKATKKATQIRIWLKILVFILVLTSLYVQLSKVNWADTKGLNLVHFWALLVSLLLLNLNLGLEFWKWKAITNPLKIESKYIKNSFWAGIASGFMTPNGWGNFLGRMIYFQKRDRIYIVFATALANLSQLLPTLFFGLIALSWLKSPEHVSIWLYVSALGMGIVLLYFFADRVIPRKKSSVKWVRYMQFIRGRYNSLKLKLLVFSSLRYLIFSLQFVLIFVSFGYTDFWFLLRSVWLIYIITAFVPSLWSGKVLIRESAALFVLQGSMVSVPDILIASILIYIINIALPAFLSSFVWLPKKQ